MSAPSVWYLEANRQLPVYSTVDSLADAVGLSDAGRASWMRFASPDGRWSDSQRRGHFVAVSLRAQGRCRLTDYRLRIGLTGAELARRVGVGASCVSALETGLESPLRDAFYTHSDAWTDTAQRIADTLGVTCSWLWPEHAPATPRLMREETPTPEALYADAEMRERVRAAVASLPPRERAVIVRRFGLVDGEEATLEETAPHVGGVSRERVRQLEVQAIRQLRAILRNARDGAA